MSHPGGDVERGDAIVGVSHLPEGRSQALLSTEPAPEREETKVCLVLEEVPSVIGTVVYRVGRDVLLEEISEGLWGASLGHGLVNKRHRGWGKG